MADKSLKASIQVDMDAKGVARGVAATNRELDKLNRTARATSIATGISAGISVVQTAFGAISGILSQIYERANQLDQLGRTFGREGQTENLKLMNAKMMADVEIGKAMSLGSAAVAQQQQKSLMEEVARVRSGDIPAGVTSLEVFGNTLLGSLKKGKDQFISNFADPFAVDQPSVLGAIEGGLGVPQFYSQGMTGADLAGGVGSARGMPYDPDMAKQNRILQSIDQKMGGQ